MALWGSRDSFTLTGTAFANSTVNTTTLTGTSTVFTTELEVGDSVIIAGSYRKVTGITSNTVLTFEPAWTAANVAGTVYGSDQPKWLAANSETIQSTQFANTQLSFGVDTNEAIASSHTHAGWVLKKTYTDMHGNPRSKVETLVAMPTITGTDWADDTVFPDSQITIVTQPSSNTAANNSAASFTIVASILPVGNTINYRWQRAANVNAAFVDLTNTGTYTNTTNTTLTIANNTIAAGGGGLSNALFRVTMSSVGQSANTTSANATLITV
jgi:hypothetical protein